MRSGDVLLVGSVPGASVEDVFRRCSQTLGTRAYAYPDGELGPRQMWVGALGELAYAGHPDLERIADAGLPFGTYAPRAGRAVAFDDAYPYGELAVRSYETFRALRDAGELPETARFQVSLPTAHAAITTHFADPDRWPALIASWSRAMQRGYDQMLATLPAEDLVIQLDYCTEVGDIAGARDGRPVYERVAGRPRDERIRTHTEPSYIAPMVDGLPNAVTLGYHLCLGTWPRWPGVPLTDLGLVVELANRLVESTPRRVDFLHLPVTPDADDAYFAPLAELTRGPNVFLGLECGDGVAALRRRTKLASRHCSAFGAAHFCGYGREHAARIDALLRDLVAG